jgi:hypothetical protein
MIENEKQTLKQQNKSLQEVIANLNNTISQQLTDKT